jgi:hypothetical protein
VYDNAAIPSSATSWTIPSGVLQNGVSYAWNVQATNPAGQSSWSTPFFFTVNNGSGGTPPIPSGLSPGSTSSPGSAVTTLTPTLTWNASSGATAYSVAVSQLNGGVVCSENVTTNSATCPAFQSGSTYFWTVSASNSAGSSATAPVVFFTVTLPAPVVGSVSPSPVPGSNNDQTLQIYGSNFVNGATLTYYDTNNTPYPGHSATFVNSGQLTDPAFDNANDAGTWKVRVVNPGGQTSNTYSFVVN